MMNFEEIKQYWENRADRDSSAQSTTQDYYLREIEFGVLSERIQRYFPRLIADIGCGDGRTTMRLAGKFPNIFFSGFDYSSSMVKNAEALLLCENLSNMSFDKLDICKGLKKSFDLIFTTRCLINLPSWELQKIAIKAIHEALNFDGVFIMIENFIEGQEKFNRVRKEFGLPEIPVRKHNLFFEKQSFFEYIYGMFEIEEDVNISSSYYLVSRIIYSKICAETGKQPDYFDDHHRFAAGLPFCGEFGPVRLLCLKKKKGS